MESQFVNKKVLVTGGAGFIGSHLVDRLLDMGAKVVAVDNLITGSLDNLRAAEKKKAFQFIKADVSEPADRYLTKVTRFDFIFHLASPASPHGYMEKPIETYKVNSFGTHYLMELSKKTKARFLFASTSEVYGDPKEHPQKETYWGNVNPIGVRACYDESKRFGEMVVSTFIRKYQVDARIVRIFNTYGSRMNPKDGRVIPNFIIQALKEKPITVHGDGKQTRSFCYVSDLIEFLLRAMIITQARDAVINIGNEKEFTVLELAKEIKRLTKSRSKIIFVDRPEDDPNRRNPDIVKAKQILGYEPQVRLEKGLRITIDYFKKNL